MSTIAKSRARQNLARLWLSAAALVFVLLLVQSLRGVYPDLSASWGWFSSMVLPAPALILGVLVNEAARGRPAPARVDRFVYHVTFGLSGLYLAAVLLTLLWGPLTGDALSLLVTSNTYLGILQSLVAAALGVFFAAKPAEDDAAGDAQPPVPARPAAVGAGE